MLKAAYSDLSHKGNKIFVTIAGNIGSGKTTLARKLSDRLGWKSYYESVQDNPYLEDFYQDMKSWAFPLQVYFLNHRFGVHQKIQGSNESSIQDRSLYEDAHIFARALKQYGHISSRDYETYLGLYRTMATMVEPPTLVIFLRRSIPKLMERIEERGRNCEKNMDVEYISRLNGFYDEWFEVYRDGKSLLIQTDELDFLHNDKHFDMLVQKIHGSMEQTDMFYQTSQVM